MLLHTSQGILEHQRWCEDLKSSQKKKYNYLKKKKKKEAVITTSELSETLHFIIKPSSLKIAGRLGALCCRPSPPPLVLTSSSLPCSHSVVVPHFREHTVLPSPLHILLLRLGFLSISFHLIGCLSSFRSQPKGHFFNEAFPEHSVKST